MNRRDVLKGAAAITAGALITPGVTITAEAATAEEWHVAEVNFGGDDPNDHTMWSSLTRLMAVNAAVIPAARFPGSPERSLLPEATVSALKPATGQWLRRMNMLRERKSLPPLTREEMTAYRLLPEAWTWSESMPSRGPQAFSMADAVNKRTDAWNLSTA